jgi:hypothetical protein
MVSIDEFLNPEIGFGVCGGLATEQPGVFRRQKIEGKGLLGSHVLKRWDGKRMF